MKMLFAIAIWCVLPLICRSQVYSGTCYSPTGLTHEQIDTLWILPAEFRIGIIDDNGLRNHSPNMSRSAEDSMAFAIANYFSDTDVKAATHQFVRYPMNYGFREFDSIQTKQIQDSILNFYHRILIKHTNKKKPISVPSYFFDLMEEQKMDHALVIFGEGFSRPTSYYNQSAVIDLIAFLLTSGASNAMVSQYESNLTLLILDRKLRQVVFVGRSYYPIPPDLELALHFQLHTIFDEFLKVPLPVKSAQ